MRKIAMFSDVHANLHALEAVWAHIEREVPDTVYCLGDLVGYGVYPNEVIEFIKSRGTSLRSWGITTKVLVSICMIAAAPTRIRSKIGLANFPYLGVENTPRM